MTDTKILTETSASKEPQVPSYSEASRFITKSVPSISIDEIEDAKGFAF
jgi:hypothetical protein